MDAREFLGLRVTHNPLRWYLEIVPGICTDGLFPFGGCGLGAAIEALERTTGRPVVWPAAQYLSNARPPEIMDVDLTVAATGHRTTQARAVAHVGDREVLTVNAALGAREVPCRASGPGCGRSTRRTRARPAAGQSCVVRAWQEDRLASLDAVEPTVPQRTTGR